MRILLDYYYNEKQETFNGIRICDIEEIESVCLQPVWNSKHSTDELPDYLYIFFYHHGDTEEDAIAGKYIFDDSVELFNNAIANYNEVVENLLTKGYCKISDFKNVNWF